MAQKKYVSLSRLSKFLDNLKDTFAPLTHKHTISDFTDYTVDSEFSSTSTNPIQNKVIDAELEAIAASMNILESEIDNKSDSSHVHDERYYTEIEVDEIIAEHTHSYDDLRNKPFYEGTDYSSILVGDELTTNFYEWGGGVYGSAITDAPKVFSQDTSYKVIWDGMEHTITCSYGGNNEYGNPITSLGAPYGDYSTYSFGIDSYVNASGSSEFSIHTDSTESTHTIDILELTSSFVTLDERFIPDSIARTTEVDEINNVINNIPTVYETKTDASSKLTEAKNYADNVSLGVKNDLLNGAGDAYDTLKELGDLITENTDAIDALEIVATSKMNSANPTGTGSLSMNRKSGTTVGDYSVVIGYNNEASSQYAYAEGVDTKAIDYAAHAEGDRTTASSTGAHAEGQSTVASGLQAHAEGRGSIASGIGSHAQGMGTEASGTGSHSEGTGTKAEGMYSHAEGASTVAKGYQTHAEGSGTIASGSDQHVQGRYNIETPYQFAHIVGNGSSDTERSNMHTLDWQGNAWYSGDVIVGGSSMTDSIASRVTTEADHEWNLIYDSGFTTTAVNSFANIDATGYKNFMIAVSCVNNGNPSTKAGAVIFKATNGTTYQFPVWGNMFSASNVGCGGMGEFKFIDGYIVCPNANRVVSNSNFLNNTEGGTAVNLIGQGGGIMKCTNTISTITVSSLDQNASYYFGAGSRLMIWGWNA